MSLTTRIIGILCLTLFIILFYKWNTSEVYLWTVGGILAIVAQVLNYIGSYFQDDIGKDLARAPVALITLLIIAYLSSSIGIVVLIGMVCIFWLMVIIGWVTESLI